MTVRRPRRCFVTEAETPGIRDARCLPASSAPAGGCSGRPWSGRGSRCACHLSSGVRSAGRRHEPSCGVGWSSGRPRSLASRGTLYGAPAGPYAVLLRRAGCEYGDLARLVARDGAEGALAQLFRAGVYLTVDEFKGRRPVVRGSTSFAWSPDACETRRSAFHVAVRSSGSRSGGTPVLMDLAFVRGCGVETCSRSRPGATRVGARRSGGTPGGRALARLLEYARFGPVPERWFSQVDPAAAPLHPGLAGASE